MIALRPFSKKIGHTLVNIREGKEIPKLVIASYSSEELKELKDKKIIGDSLEKKKSFSKDNK